MLPLRLYRPNRLRLTSQLGSSFAETLHPTDATWPFTDAVETFVGDTFSPVADLRKPIDRQFEIAVDGHVARPQQLLS